MVLSRYRIDRCMPAVDHGWRKGCLRSDNTRAILDRSTILDGTQFLKEGKKILRAD